MHEENKNQNTQKENLSLPPEILGQLEGLSDVWRELLGGRVSERPALASPSDTPIPILAVDPWSALIQANGTEVVDLQHVHLQISDQEVEQILQVMRDNPDTKGDTSPTNADPNSNSKSS